MQLSNYDLSNLAMKNGKIDWKNCNGRIIKFTYQDIEDGTIKFIDNIDAKKAIVEYNDKQFQVIKNDLKLGKIARIIGLKNDFLYEIGDVIENANAKIKILDRMKVLVGNGKTKHKKYKFLCMRCKHQGVTHEFRIKENMCVCQKCSGVEITIGENDMWTTNPELASLLLNPKDGYKYKQFSNQKVLWKCPHCNQKIEAIINNVNKQGLSCPKCGDGFSYPNKFMFNLLTQMNIEFETESIFDWCRNIDIENKTIQFGKYDFYIPSKNLIIEMDGMLGHGNSKNKILSKEGTLEFDKIKEKLAKDNGIKLIRIDSKKSTMKYICNNILESELSLFFDLSKINWNECNKYAHNSNWIYEVCQFKKKNPKLNNEEIGKQLKISRSTVYKYLNIGKELGFIA